MMRSFWSFLFRSFLFRAKGPQKSDGGDLDFYLPDHKRKGQESNLSSWKFQLIVAIL